MRYIFVPVMFALMLIAGVQFGASAVDADNPRPDVDGMLEEELFHANGSVAVEQTEPRAEPPGVERVEDLGPDTPRYDAAVRQWLVRPLLLAGIWLVDLGTRVGYGLATVIGPTPTALLGYGGGLGVLALPGIRVYRLFEEVDR
jgi:hypothetical protein